MAVSFSNCCCGLFSLRFGTLILSSMMAIAGAFSTVAAVSGIEVLSGLFNLVVGGIGVYASYYTDVKWLRIFFYVLFGAFILELVLVVAVILLHQQIFVQDVDTSACDQAKDKEECKKMVREFSGQAYFFAWLGNMIFLGLVNLWLLLVVYSFLRVVELGGTGDEKLSPEAYEKLAEAGGAVRRDTDERAPLIQNGANNA